MTVNDDSRVNYAPNCGITYARNWWHWIKAKAKGKANKKLSLMQSSLILNIILKHTQTLQLNSNTNYLQK
jgi:hypothetical protein